MDEIGSHHTQRMFTYEFCEKSGCFAPVAGIAKEEVDELIELVERSKYLKVGPKDANSVKDRVVQTCALVFAGQPVAQVS